MWLVNILVLASGMACSLLQNPASSEQNPSPSNLLLPLRNRFRLARRFPRWLLRNPSSPFVDFVVKARAQAERKPGNPCSKQITRKDFETPDGCPESRRPKRFTQWTAEPGPGLRRKRWPLRMLPGKPGRKTREEFREVMFWVRLRTIADLYRRNLQEKYRTPEPEEIDSYYQQHVAFL